MLTAVRHDDALTAALREIGAKTAEIPEFALCPGQRLEQAPWRCGPIRRRMTRPVVSFNPLACDVSDKRNGVGVLTLNDTLGLVDIEGDEAVLRAVFNPRHAYVKGSVRPMTAYPITHPNGAGRTRPGDRR